MQTNKIEVSKEGKGKTLYVALSVFRSGRDGLTISCSDPDHAFKFGTTPKQLEKFRDKLDELHRRLVRK